MQPTNIDIPQSSFFRALNAPFLPTPFLEDGPRSGLLPRVANPAVPKGLGPLAVPIYTSTGEWEWLNNHTFHDIRDLATLQGGCHFCRVLIIAFT